MHLHTSRPVLTACYTYNCSDKRHERIEARKVGADDADGPQMQFNDVKVKAVDKSISQLRASMDQSSAPRSVANSRMSATTNNQEGSTSGATAAPVKPILETLSQALMNKLRGNEVHRALEGRKDAFVVSTQQHDCDEHEHCDRQRTAKHHCPLTLKTNATTQI